jgi:hypothetical protein
MWKKADRSTYLSFMARVAEALEVGIVVDIIMNRERV